MNIQIPDIESTLEQRMLEFARLTERGTVSAHAEDVRTDMRALLTMLDTDEQKEAYGPHWSDHYRTADAESTRDAWKSGKHARVQFALSDEYVVPALPNGTPEKHSMKGFLFNPGKIPGSMLLKTGLVKAWEFDAANGNPIDRLILAHDSIPAVKKMLEAARPIAGNNRLLRIADPSEDPIVDARYPDVPDPSPDAIGGIVYLRTKPGPKRTEETELHTFANGAYDAHRKTLHAENGYNGEMGELVSCQRELDRARLRLDIDYRRDKTAAVKEEAWRAAEGAMARVAHALRNVQAANKVEARDFVAGAMEQRTPKGLPNPTAAMAKITAALTRIEKRFAEMGGKNGFNAKDRLTLHEQIRRGENAMLAVRYRVMDVANGTTDAATARAELDMDVRDLEKIDLRPLSVFADATIRQIQHLREGDAFEEDLLRLHVVGKLQGIRTSAERIRANAATMGRIDFAAEARFARQVEDAVLAEQILPGMTMPALEDVMEPVCERWSALRAFLEDRDGQPRGEPQEEKDALDALVDALDTELSAQAIVSALPKAVPYTPPYRLTNII
jgi:hypothetical protein